MKRGLIGLIAIAVTTFACSFTLAAEAEAPNKTLAAAREVEKAFVETIKKAVPAYVFFPGGSGVLISADGYVLTNHHVVKGRKVVKVRTGGKFYQAATSGVDASGDIALLKLPNVSNMPYLEMADSDALRVGQQVIAIGNPFNTSDVGGERTDEPTVTTGIVSAMHRFEANYTDAIQTDASVNPGNSGGPLVTMDGKLAGINGLIETKLGNAANTGVALAIPVNQIKRFLPRLKEAKGETVPHGFIRGVNSDQYHKVAARLRDNEFDLGDDADGIRNGVEVQLVDAGSPAEKLGLQKGDKIIKLDDYPLLNFERFYGVQDTYPAGSEVKLTYERNGKKKWVTARLEKFVNGKLGIEMVVPAVRENPLQTPAVIAKVEAGGPAGKAGVQPNDEILAINGKSVRNLFEVRLFMQYGIYAGDKMKLKVRRGPKDTHEDLEVDVTAVPDETPRPTRRP